MAAEREKLPAIVANNSRRLGPYPEGREIDPRRVVLKILRVDVPDQESDRWCWAAVTLAIARAHGKLRSKGDTQQCQVAARVLSLKHGRPFECCPRATVGACDEKMELHFALTVYDCLSSWIRQGTLDWESLKRRIDERAPVPIRIVDESGEGHYILITGYRENPGANGERYVFYDDPLTKGGVRTYETFQSREDGRRWTDTYLTPGRGRIRFRFLADGKEHPDASGSS